MRVTGRRAAAAIGIGSAAALLVLGACNLGDDAPVSFVSGGRGGTGGSRRFDSGSAVPQEQCALAAPGAGCDPGETPVCEIGEHPDLRCNARLDCAALHWEEVLSSTECAITCPPELEVDRPDGCAIPNAGTLRCEYPSEGVTCGCAPVVRDGGTRPRDAAADAAEAGDADGGRESTSYVWTCVRPDAGCPRSRPRLGARCVRPMTCDYGACSFEDGVAVRCYNKTWTQVDDPCRR